MLTETEKRVISEIREGTERWIKEIENGTANVLNTIELLGKFDKKTYRAYNTESLPEYLQKYMKEYQVKSRTKYEKGVEQRKEQKKRQEEEGQKLLGRLQEGMIVKVRGTKDGRGIREVLEWNEYGITARKIDWNHRYGYFKDTYITTHMSSKLVKILANSFEELQEKIKKS